MIDDNIPKIAETTSLRVAVASKHGTAIDEHFGHAKAFHIFDIVGGNVASVSIREVPHYCLGGHSDRTAMESILETISDCTAVFVARIGDGPIGKLKARNIEAVSDYTWEEIVPSLINYSSKKRG